MNRNHQTWYIDKSSESDSSDSDDEDSSSSDSDTETKSLYKELIGKAAVVEQPNTSEENPMLEKKVDELAQQV
ncbi:hypothetical protein IWQ62_005581 [Dispira parvispora]|uniref:Uncharacterized protein n=1 Tax=Dispira parvispora TaxID=1520584 RepID=A0A9W8DZH4_9FUNG|nr:hypothetical protein IWQ62_005581 [Dispira parvispora]